MVFIEKDDAQNVDAAGSLAGSMQRRPIPRPARAGSLFALVLSGAALLGAALPGPSVARSAPGLGEPVALSSLSPEAQRTERLIHSGGPFPYAKDGAVFGNYEKRLARHPRGYYHEYTVPTPHARNRGARRIICGGEKPTEPDACFYTEDHYNSFHRIIE